MGYTVIFKPAVQTDCIIDLSHNNRIDAPTAAFATAKTSGVAMVILKATQGSDEVDNTFAERRAAAQAAGLLVGAYHFCDGTDTGQQASHFLGTVGDLTGLVLALDAEANPTSQVTAYQVCGMIYEIEEKTGKAPLLYMGRNGPDNRGTYMNEANVVAYLAQCPLWLPEYGSTPVLPNGFTKWVMHQYTGDGINGSGFVAGIGSKLDRSFFAGTAADLTAWHAANAA